MLLYKKKWFLLVFLMVIANFSVDCKRSGGRSRGSSRGSSTFSRMKPKADQASSFSFWNQKTKEKPKSETKPESPKPVSKVEPVATKQNMQKTAASAPIDHQNAAPPAPIGFDNVNRQQNPLQQSSNGQRPIGWNVGQSGDGYINRNTAWNAGSYPRGAPPPYHVAVGQSPNYPTSGGFGYPNGQGGTQNGFASHIGPYPNTGSNNFYGAGHNYNYGNGYNPQPMFNQGLNQPMTGGYPNMYNNPQGVGTNPYGGQIYGQQTSSVGGGLLGGLFGTKKHGYGGYGGMGGHPAYGGHSQYGGFGGVGGIGSYVGYNMMKRKKSGIFGKHAFRNILAGLLVWNLMKGVFTYKYRVYNFYNNPINETQEINLPANLIVLCEENATSLCLPNTTALCTMNKDIMCVTTVATLTPCEDNANLNCVNSTIACDPSDASCNIADVDNVSVPCIANATIDTSKMDLETASLLKQTLQQSQISATGTLENGTSFCVTMMAIPDNEAPTKICENNDNTSCIPSNLTMANVTNIIETSTSTPS